MNTERLLQHYERIADAPDAIARLRRFILNLAVRGKLVPQDPNDEPESDLLKRIANEKLDQADLPQGWRRAKIGSILNFQYGKGLKASERLDEGAVPVFGSNGIVGFTDEPLTDRSAIIVGRKGSAGALNLCDGPSWTTDVAYFVEAPAFFDLRFMLNALAALDLDKLGKGVKPGLSRSEAYDQIITLPPLAEQHRIVAKVEELMDLCNRLEAVRESREATRDRLAAASLARLEAPDPETFRADACFALDALPALTTRPDQIKRLRQTILSLAVSGKLVPQDPNDEPASELLKRIVKERSGPQAVKKARRNGETDVSNLRTDTPLPVGWLWTNIDEIALSMRYGTSTKCEYAAPGVPVLRIPNVSDGVVSLDDMKFGPLTDGELRDLALSTGDLLMIRSNGSLDIVGRSAVVTAEAEGMAFAGYLVRLRTSAANIKPEYIWLAMSSTDVRDQIEKPIRSAVGLKNVNLTEFGALTIPLPPLAEQHRIVAKVDALMALCDRLEASLSAAADTRRRLLDALLAETLAPKSERSSNSKEIEPDARLAYAPPNRLHFKERTAIVLALAYERHQRARRDKSFGHVKAQKILHIVEAEAELDLGRAPVKDAAGPNDFSHMLEAEDWALKNQHFSFEKIDSGYRFRRLEKFEQLIRAARLIEPATRTRIEEIIDLFVPMDMERAEIFATVYAAWNNLLIEGKNPTDDEIVRASREDWHPSKTRFPPAQFIKALEHLRRAGYSPRGRGRLVREVKQARLFS